MDVTDRMTAESALRAGEERFRVRRQHRFIEHAKPL
jgi:hypothetical protein